MRPFTCMNTHMIVEILAVRELLRTYVTMKLLNSRVNVHMLVEMVPLPETFIADTARKRLLAGMDKTMQTHISVAGKRFLAHVTRVWFLTSMSTQMNDQRLLLPKHHCTVIALERFVSFRFGMIQIVIGHAML